MRPFAMKQISHSLAELARRLIDNHLDSIKIANGGISQQRCQRCRIRSERLEPAKFWIVVIIVMNDKRDTFGHGDSIIIAQLCLVATQPKIGGLEDWKVGGWEGFSSPPIFRVLPGFACSQKRLKLIGGVVSWMIANAAPCGSCAMAKRPVCGISVGGVKTWPPSALTFSALASQSATAK